jgi:hypothetical protein
VHVLIGSLPKVFLLLWLVAFAPTVFAVASLGKTTTRNQAAGFVAPDAFIVSEGPL